jgi:hypothetical protein
VLQLCQVARNGRITAWVKQQPPSACFVVDGTMMDPRWLDPSLEVRVCARARCLGLRERRSDAQPNQRSAGRYICI